MGFRIIVMVLILSGWIYSQMIPLAHKNYWYYISEYTDHEWFVQPGKIDSNGCTYFKLTNKEGYLPRLVRLREDGYYVILRDSSYDEPDHEEIYYKQGALPGDSWTQKIPGNFSTPHFFTTTVEDTISSKVYGKRVIVRFLHYYAGIVEEDQVYTEEFGLLGTSDIWGPTSTLMGCVIDGVLYGDTSTTSVSYSFDPGLPYKMELSQNYPNPFNPSTRIEYYLPRSGNVVFEIFDITGKKVAEPFNGFKNHGNHSFIFSGENFAGGVYLYSLRDNRRRVVKKMIYLK